MLFVFVKESYLNNLRIQLNSNDGCKKNIALDNCNVMLNSKEFKTQEKTTDKIEWNNFCDMKSDWENWVRKVRNVMFVGHVKKESDRKKDEFAEIKTLDFKENYVWICHIQ